MATNKKQSIKVRKVSDTAGKEDKKAEKKAKTATHPVTRTAAKKATAPVKKTIARKKAAVKKASTGKAAAKKTASRKTPVKKTATRKPSVHKTAVKPDVDSKPDDMTEEKPETKQEEVTSAPETKEEGLDKQKVAKAIEQDLREVAQAEDTRKPAAPPPEKQAVPKEQAVGHTTERQEAPKEQMAAPPEKKQEKEGEKRTIPKLAPLPPRKPAETKEEDVFMTDLPKSGKPRSLGLYRKIAYSFIVLTLILLATIFYFAFVNVTITLVPNQERMSNNMIFDVYDKEQQLETGGTRLTGVVREVPISLEENYGVNGTVVIGEETVGKVAIINDYIKNQPLVATTRLLSPDNKLFRLRDTVNVPAGGSVEVEVYADESGDEMAIEPTTFTIPGLWAGLQDKIYAKSSEAFVNEKKVKKYVVQADIENGIRDLKQKLLAKVRSDINETYREYDQIIYTVDDNSVASDVDGKIGEEREEIIITMQANVVVVAFNEARAADLARQKFTSALPADKELIEFDDQNIIYSLDNFNLERGTASINATFEGKVSLKDTAEIVDTEKVLGLNEEQLNAYLSAIPEIAGYNIEFYPSFIHKVPNLVDRVKVEIKK